LDLIAVVDGHPFFARLDGDADKDARIVVGIAHFEDNSNSAIADFAARPIEQTHAAMSPNETVFDCHAAWTNMLPTGEILAIEERFPLTLGNPGSDQEDDCSNQKKRTALAH
jgi:hypothetical protein